LSFLNSVSTGRRGSELERVAEEVAMVVTDGLADSLEELVEVAIWSSAWLKPRRRGKIRKANSFRSMNFFRMVLRDCQLLATAMEPVRMLRDGFPVGLSGISAVGQNLPMSQVVPWEV